MFVKEGRGGEEATKVRARHYYPGNFLPGSLSLSLSLSLTLSTQMALSLSDPSSLSLSLSLPLSDSLDFLALWLSLALYAPPLWLSLSLSLSRLYLHSQSQAASNKSILCVTLPVWEWSPWRRRGSAAIRTRGVHALRKMTKVYTPSATRPSPVSLNCWTARSWIIISHSCLNNRDGRRAGEKR